MIDVAFSTQDNGACAFCMHHGDCSIQNSIIETLNLNHYEINDDDFEIVIYRCPKFIEDM